MRPFLTRPGHVLCLGAHADDIEIGCGATILHLTETAPTCRITWVVFSADGVRRQEAEVSARAFLGSAADIRVLQFTDTRFPVEWGQIKTAFDDLGRSMSPDVIFTHRRDDLHQDHRVLAELTWNTFRDHWILEYEIPKYDGDLGCPNVYVPATRHHVELKIELLNRSFASQTDKPWFRDETFRGLAALRGLECRAPEGLAEGFHARKTVVDLGQMLPEVQAGRR